VSKDRKQVFVHPDAIEAAEVWPNGQVSLHLANGENFGSVKNQELDPSITAYIAANMLAVRGEEIKKETDTWD
jgi:hypothetical protein